MQELPIERTKFRSSNFRLLEDNGPQCIQPSGHVWWEADGAVLAI